MLRSMTGFAQAQVAEGPFMVTVTLRALNHRFLDLHVRLGAELEGYEPRIRAWVRERVRRGHVEVNMQVQSSERSVLGVNRELVRNYIEIFNALRQEYKLAAEPDLSAILRLPGALQTVSYEYQSEENPQLAAAIERALGQALDALDHMRATEGEVLAQELRARAERIREANEQIAARGAQARPAYFKRLQERLRELLGATPLDETRLVQEVAYLAERSDISEEVTRLRSHVEQFLGLLTSDAAVGKRLDFLLQEMHRETNTLLAKFPPLEAAGLEMTQLALGIKAEIERLREQVQNVE